MASFVVCSITPGAHICRGVRTTFDEALDLASSLSEAGAMHTLDERASTEGVEWIITDNLQVGRYWAIRHVSDGG